MPLVVEVHLRSLIELLVVNLYFIVVGMCFISRALLAACSDRRFLFHLVVNFIGFDPILLDLVYSNV